jgi:hypothetical protein
VNEGNPIALEISIAMACAGQARQMNQGQKKRMPRLRDVNEKTTLDTENFTISPAKTRFRSCQCLQPIAKSCLWGAPKVCSSMVENGQ